LAEVRLENVTRERGLLCPVHDLTIEVEDKKFVALLAPSGSGKTTIMRIIAGLEPVEAGDVYIGGERVNDLSPAERDVALVFQTYALYPHLTVYENLASPLRAVKAPENEVEKNVKQVAETLNITPLLNKLATQLSGGEMQRVAIGRAIIRRPKVYLFDEPLTNLDAKLRVHMRAELKRLQKDLGQTAIYATHDEVEAMTMADKIAVLRHGRLIQYDTPDEVYHHPRNLFVADFIGSPPINTFDCTFKEEDGRCLLDAGEFTVNVDEYGDLIKKAAKSDELILGIRPSDFTLEETGKKKDIIPAVLYVSEPMGAVTILDLKVGEKLVKVKVKGRYEAEIGKKVWLHFNRDRIHIFDKKTQETIV